MYELQLTKDGYLQDCLVIPNIRKGAKMVVLESRQSLLLQLLRALSHYLAVGSRNKVTEVFPLLRGYLRCGWETLQLSVEMKEGCFELLKVETHVPTGVHLFEEPNRKELVFNTRRSTAAIQIKGTDSCITPITLTAATCSVRTALTGSYTVGKCML